GYMLDLLAAVPSVVYGLWGVYYLVPRLIPVERWLNDTLGFIPLFDSRNGTYGRSLFAASVVLAIMVLPIVAAIAREVFRQVPRADKEAALALGATRWETIRLSVLPYSRSGIVGAIMLGLGRALGETIAVALVLASLFKVDFHILEPGGNTIAANIATKFGEAGVHGREALIASGLVLFAITLVVNVIARGVVYRTGHAAVRHKRATPWWASVESIGERAAPRRRQRRRLHGAGPGRAHRPHPPGGGAGLHHQQGRPGGDGQLPHPLDARRRPPRQGRRRVPRHSGHARTGGHRQHPGRPHRVARGHLHRRVRAGPAALGRALPG